MAETENETRPLNHIADDLHEIASALELGELVDLQAVYYKIRDLNTEIGLHLISQKGE